MLESQRQKFSSHTCSFAHKNFQGLGSLIRQVIFSYARAQAYDFNSTGLFVQFLSTASFHVPSPRALAHSTPPGILTHPQLPARVAFLGKPSLTARLNQIPSGISSRRSNTSF